MQLPLYFQCTSMNKRLIHHPLRIPSCWEGFFLYLSSQENTPKGLGGGVRGISLTVFRQHDQKKASTKWWKIRHEENEWPERVEIEGAGALFLSARRPLPCSVYSSSRGGHRSEPAALKEAGRALLPRLGAPWKDNTHHDRAQRSPKQTHTQSLKKKSSVHDVSAHPSHPYPPTPRCASLNKGEAESYVWSSSSHLVRHTPQHPPRPHPRAPTWYKSMLFLSPWKGGDPFPGFSSSLFLCVQHITSSYEVFTDSRIATQNKKTPPPQQAPHAPDRPPRHFLNTWRNDSYSRKRLSFL